MVQYQVSFGQAISRAFSRYFNFSARASRSEYWFFVLFNFIVGGIFSGFAYFSTDAGEIVTSIYSIAVIIPGLALAVRRLHDTGRGGGWIFIGLIPLVGTIILIIFFCQQSEPTPNRFGSVPNLVER